MHTAQYTNPENLLFITAAGAIPAAITIGKMIAEPENVSALTAVTNNMIQTFLLFFLVERKIVLLVERDK